MVLRTDRVAPAEKRVSDVDQTRLLVPRSNAAFIRTELMFFSGKDVYSLSLSLELLRVT